MFDNKNNSGSSVTLVHYRVTSDYYPGEEVTSAFNVIPLKYALLGSAITTAYMVRTGPKPDFMSIDRARVPTLFTLDSSKIRAK